MTTSADATRAAYPSALLPRSARMACWLRALVDGRTSLDDAGTAISADDAVHHVAGLDGDDTEPLVLALGRLRSRAPGWLHVATPVPGDLTGLAGPPELNAETLEAGECVLLGDQAHHPTTALVPHVAGAGVVWQMRPAADPPPYDLPEAHRALRRALPVAADTLSDLDVARWSPDAADLLLNVRAPLDLDLAPGTPADSAAVLGTALRCLAIVDVALDADSAAVSASERALRTAALQPLERAARHAVAAACSTPRGHPQYR